MQCIRPYRYVTPLEVSMRTRVLGINPDLFCVCCWPDPDPDADNSLPSSCSSCSPSSSSSLSLVSSMPFSITTSSSSSSTGRWSFFFFSFLEIDLYTEAMVGIVPRTTVTGIDGLMRCTSFIRSVGRTFFFSGPRDIVTAFRFWNSCNWWVENVYTRLGRKYIDNPRIYEYGTSYIFNVYKHMHLCISCVQLMSCRDKNRLTIDPNIPLY